MSSVTTTDRALRSASALRRRSTSPSWKRKNSSKIRRRCAGGPERIQFVDRRPGGRKMDIGQCTPPRHEPLALTHVRGQRVRNVLGQLRQGAVHDRALHLRRQCAGLLVDRNDPSGVQRVVVRLALCRVGVCAVRISFGLDDFVLRILQLQPVRRQFEAAEQDHALMGMEDVVEKWLVEEHRAQATRSRRARASRKS